MHRFSHAPTYVVNVYEGSLRIYVWEFQKDKQFICTLKNCDWLPFLQQIAWIFTYIQHEPICNLLGQINMPTKICILLFIPCMLIVQAKVTFTNLHLWKCIGCHVATCVPLQPIKFFLKKLLQFKLCIVTMASYY